jgi:serine acetyltransferase/glycosyltransferase involved in cell wall biosynthesis
MNKSGKQQIGVVVIGRNEGERLIRCLDSLREAACLVYVDSGSTDGSQQAALERGAELVELDLSRPFSMTRARNEGFAKVCERLPDVPFVQFVDGDCEVVESWIPTALTALEENADVAVVCGRRRERFPENSIYNRMCDIEWNTPIGPAASCGGDALMRAEVFKQTGGFNEKLIAGEEPELCLRIRKNNWKILRLDAEMTLHDANILHFREWWKRNVRGGYGAKDVVMRLAGSYPADEIPFHHMTKSAVSWTRNWLVFALLLIGLGWFIYGLIGAAIGAVAALGLQGLQALRIARGIRDRATSTIDAVTYGCYTMLGKWAQALGQQKYNKDRRANKEAAIIEYKSDAPTGGSAWKQDKARYPAKAFVREQSMWALAVYRFGRWGDTRSSGIARFLMGRLYWFAYRIVETQTGISFTKLAEIGPGLRIHHFGNIFIHSDAKIGSGCTLRQGVTIGNRKDGGPVPVIGNNVEFGAYAQVLGGISIGEGARIGAMSVVLKDVPPGATAVGNPARILTQKAEKGSEAT